MEKKIHSVKYAKQRRFLMILPLLTLPFFTLMFWAFGGGKGSNAQAQSIAQQGLNLKLPDAKLKDDKKLNKLSFYQQAALDSAKTKEAEKLDPYWKQRLGDSSLSTNNSYSLSGEGMDENQMKVYSKLDELKKVLGKNQETESMNGQSARNPYSLKSYSSSNDMDRLQSMMQKINGDKTEDPAISQLNDMLDKIQAIQNPDPLKNTTKSNTGKNLSIKTKNHKAEISLLKDNAQPNTPHDTSTTTNAGNGFYGTTTFNADNDSSFYNAIEAIIPEKQTVVAGSTIKLALTNDVTVQDVTIPSGSFIYGTTSLSNERLKIEISTIRFQKSILPVTLKVYDMDGQEGIDIPGSINRTVAKESANNALGGIRTTTINPSIESQAVSAGIEAGKTLFSKKIKLTKMTVKAGYKVLLKDNNDK